MGGSEEATDLGLAQLWLLRPFKEWTGLCKISFCLSIFLSVSFFVTLIGDIAIPINGLTTRPNAHLYIHLLDNAFDTQLFMKFSATQLMCDWVHILSCFWALKIQKISLISLFHLQQFQWRMEKGKHFVHILERTWTKPDWNLAQGEFLVQILTHVVSVSIVLSFFLPLNNTVFSRLERVWKEEAGIRDDMSYRILLISKCCMQMNLLLNF